MAKFQLQLHEEKTRLIEFGRRAALDRKRRGAGKPETFNFLGFTHICGRSRKGKFQVVRKTMRQRMRAKLKELKHEFRRRLHEPVKVQGVWVSAVLRGHLRYYGVPLNSRALTSFVHQVTQLWQQTLRRRSQRGRRLTWAKFQRITKGWLPPVHICHPYPAEQLAQRLASAAVKT